MNNNALPYDLMITSAEKSLLETINNSGLTIATISLIIDKIKNNIDIQKSETIKQMIIQEENKKNLETENK